MYGMAKPNLIIIPGRLDRHLSNDRWMVDLESSIRSDVRRLSLALTVPEYIETWMTLPGNHSDCSHIVIRDGDDYAIDHQCAGTHGVRINGTYSTLERHRVSFSWAVDGMLRVPESSVVIKLHGDFESTSVILRHRGLASYQQYLWHRTLWAESLGNLKRLYEAPRSEKPVSNRIRNRPAQSLSGR